MSEIHNHLHKYVPGMGPIGAKILILGEAPSYEEVAAGKPFVGASGRELDRILKDAGLPRYECWVTNVCKYMVPQLQIRRRYHSMCALVIMESTWSNS